MIKKQKTKANRTDIIGDKFGRWTVISFSHVDESNILFFNCECSCGTKKKVRKGGLKQGASRSCGCLNLELVRKRAIQKKAKGRVKDERLYNIWQSMKQRCNDENHSEFQRYGMRGIEVNEKWNNSYAEFKSWALNNGYSDELSIDRIDNDGDYTPSNCRWSTPKEQANNRSNSLNISFEGEEMTLAQWSEKLNIPYSCLYGRLNNGWSVERSFSTPSRGSWNSV